MKTDALTIDEIKAELPKLRADFEAAFGEDSLKTYYVDQLHGLTLMKDDDVNPWNRKAHTPLMAYFMTLALGRYEELNRLKHAFKFQATQPVEKDKPPYQTNTHEMLSAIHAIVGAHLNKDIPEYDPNDYFEPHAA